jgi:polysaccharide biosynthesis protein PslF
MHIALLSAEYPPQPGGVGDYTRQLGETLAARGDHVSVFTIYDLRFTIYDLNDDNRRSDTLDRRLDWDWNSWRALIAALDRTRPDVLHIQYQTGAYGMHPAINLLPWRLRHLPGRPAVAVTAHDLLLPYLFPRAGSMRRWVTWRLLADADAVVVTNEEDLAEATRYLRQDTRDKRQETGDRESMPGLRSPVSGLRSPVLIPIGSNIPVAPPEGYDRGAWRARLQIEAGMTLVAYFGLISRTKGLDVLLDALGRLPSSYRLLVVGGAATAPEDRVYAEEVRREIDDRGLGRRVTITGHCAPEVVSAHLLAADLAALPFADGASFRRGSLLATLAHGLPTITTQPTTDDRRPAPEDQHQLGESGGRWSVVGGRLVDGENVLLIPHEDAAALAAGIARVGGDPALRERLAGGAQALAAQFEWPEIATRHEALYTALITR